MDPDTTKRPALVKTIRQQRSRPRMQHQLSNTITISVTEAISRTSTPVRTNVTKFIISPRVSPINNDTSDDEIPMFDIPLETSAIASVSPSFQQINVVHTPTQPTQPTRNRNHRSTSNKVFPILPQLELNQTSSTYQNRSNLTFIHFLTSCIPARLSF